MYTRCIVLAVLYFVNISKSQGPPPPGAPGAPVSLIYSPTNRTIIKKILLKHAVTAERVIMKLER